MLYRKTTVGVIPGINDQVGGNAHGDSDIGVYLFFLCNFTYRIWLPSLIKSIPESMHPSSPTCNTSGASVLMRRGANNRNDNSWNHSIPLEISKYHETYKHFNDRTFYLITMTKLRSCSVGHHTGAWGHDNEDRPPPPLLPYPPLTMPK